MRNSKLEIRIPQFEMSHEFNRVLIKHKFNKQDAETLSHIFTTNSLEGVYTHGVNRFSRFIQDVLAGSLLPDKKAALSFATGNIEQWDGQLGPGPINALISSNRAMEVAEQNGIGCVALRNTNHWMRGGYYGWEAAKKGFILIAWTNTTGIMPPWGSAEPKIGNNPMVIGVPYNDSAIVLDMAMAQYSYGMMEMHEMQNKKLSVAGGYDKNGKLTNDPTAVLRTRRPLPIGYWKGSGLALLLDIVAFSLSGGLPTMDVSRQTNESSVCQIFIAINLKRLQNHASINVSIRRVIEDLKKSIPVEEGKAVRYPGERVEWIRNENSEKGIPVLKKVWDEILEL